MVPCKSALRKQRTNERTNDRDNEKTNEPTSKQTNERTNERTNESGNDIISFHLEPHFDQMNVVFFKLTVSLCQAVKSVLILYYLL